MTIKKQLIQEIEQIPEDIAVQLFNFLYLLQSGDRLPFFRNDVELASQIGDR